jgi:hypothetical protein
MKKRMSLPLIGLLAASVAACNNAPSEDRAQTASDTGTMANSMNFEEAPGDAVAAPRAVIQGAGPEIRPETAPDVAFAYNYAFRLAAARVAEAQQEHQRLCERLTIDRCRITGMTYRAANETDVEATLSLSVDPSVAAQFGRESVQAVLNAEGSLAGSEIRGTDVGSSLRASGRSLSDLRARLQRTELRLRAAGNDEKGQLEYEVQTLRQQIAQLEASRETESRSLATTPMIFRYGSGNLAPGPAEAPSLREAVADTGDDFMTSLTMLLVVLIRLLPWAVAGLLIWGVIAFLRRRLTPKSPSAPVEPAIEG